MNGRRNVRALRKRQILRGWSVTIARRANLRTLEMMKNPHLQPHAVAQVSRAQASLHRSQGFHETAIAQSDSADARVVQVDCHPQSNRKNHPVDRVEQREPAARTTVAESQ